MRQAGTALHRASATALGDPLNGNHSTGSRNELSSGTSQQLPVRCHPKPYLVCQCQTRHTWSTRVAQHPGTYQVVFLALGCVLGVPLLLSAALLEVVVAAAVAVVVA